jgi:putative DNA primase/helicase
VLPRLAEVAAALWTVHAHAFAAAAAWPLLALTPPEKRCGKTTTLAVLARLVPRPLLAANITAASLFRVVEKYSPTLLVDEADSFLRDNEELRGILNSGHTRDAAYVVRTVGDEHEPRRFSTWAPKAVAIIGRLPDTLADRSIVIPMRRRARGQPVERLRLDRPGGFAELGRRAARWAADHLAALRAADPEVPGELGDRAADSWRPLLAIADLAGGEWPQQARQAAVALSSGAAEERDSVREELLGDIREAFRERAGERIFSNTSRTCWPSCAPARTGPGGSGGTARPCPRSSWPASSSPSASAPGCTGTARSAAGGTRSKTSRTLSPATFPRTRCRRYKSMMMRV